MMEFGLDRNSAWTLSLLADPKSTPAQHFKAHHSRSLHPFLVALTDVKGTSFTRVMTTIFYRWLAMVGVLCVNLNRTMMSIHIYMLISFNITISNTKRSPTCSLMIHSWLYGCKLATLRRHRFCLEWHMTHKGDHIYAICQQTDSDLLNKRKCNCSIRRCLQYPSGIFDRRKPKYGHCALCIGHKTEHRHQQWPHFSNQTIAAYFVSIKHNLLNFHQTE